MTLDKPLLMSSAISITLIVGVFRQSIKTFIRDKTMALIIAGLYLKFNDRLRRLLSKEIMLFLLYKFKTPGTRYLLRKISTYGLAAICGK